MRSTGIANHSPSWALRKASSRLAFTPVDAATMMSWLTSTLSSSARGGEGEGGLGDPVGGVLVYLQPVESVIVAHALHDRGVDDIPEVVGEGGDFKDGDGGSDVPELSDVLSDIGQDSLEETDPYRTKPARKYFRQGGSGAGNG